METSIVVIRLENVLKVSVPEMTEIDLPIMKYLVRTAKQLINGEELPIVVEANMGSSVSFEARQFSTRFRLQPSPKSIIFITPSLSAKIEASLFARTCIQNFNFKVVNNLSDLDMIYLE